MRRTSLKRSTKPIPRKRAKPRRGPLRDLGYLQFLREEGHCVACARKFFDGRINYVHLPCDPAHGPVNGMRSKGPDNEALPLCRVHHDEQTRLGHEAFVVKYDFDWLCVASAWYKAYQIWKEHTNVCEN